MDIKYIEVTTTVMTEKQAMQLSQIIISQRLAASVHITGPISSTFWWGKRLETCEEYKCVFRTAKSLYPKLEKEVMSLHPYTPAEIAVFPIIDGSEDYFKWMDTELRINEEDGDIEDAEYKDADV